MKEKPKAPHINARAETAHKLPLFREAFAKRRALIPDATVVVGVGKVRFDLNDAVVIDNCAVVVAVAIIRDAAVIVGKRVVVACLGFRVDDVGAGSDARVSGRRVSAGRPVGLSSSGA